MRQESGTLIITGLNTDNSAWSVCCSDIQVDNQSMVYKSSKTSDNEKCFKSIQEHFNLDGNRSEQHPDATLLAADDPPFPAG